MFVDTLEWKAIKPEVYAATADLPSKSTESDPVFVGKIMTDTQAKKVYQVTAVAEDGTLTKTQIGSWT